MTKKFQAGGVGDAVLRNGPQPSSPQDRIYNLGFKALAGREMPIPLLQSRIARAGELTLLERDGEWQVAWFRSSTVMQADLERMADHDGYEIEIRRKVRGDAEEIIEALNLSEATTGVPGYITIYTGPYCTAYVKWSAKVGRTEPGVAVMLAGPQPAVTPDAEGLARQWVSRNHDALVRYWWHGDSWTYDQVNVFVRNLVPITPTCTRCRKHPAVLQIALHAALCKDCDAYLVEQPEDFSECPFDLFEREQALAARAGTTNTA